MIKYMLEKQMKEVKRAVCIPTAPIPLDPEAKMFLSLGSLLLSPALARVTAPKGTLILLSTDAVTKLAQQWLHLPEVPLCLCNILSKYFPFLLLNSCFLSKFLN